MPLGASLAGPAGCGDVRMSPQHVQGYDIIEIEIRSPDGRAVLEVDRDLLVQFVDAAVALVPVGEESARMDLDIEIAFNPAKMIRAAKDFPEQAWTQRIKLLWAELYS